MSDTNCPVLECGQRKEAMHVCCAFHWKQVDPIKQKQIWRLYETERGSHQHRMAVFSAIGDLNDAVRKRKEATHAPGT